MSFRSHNWIAREIKCLKIYSKILFLEEIQGCNVSVIMRRTSISCRKIFRKKNLYSSSSRISPCKKTIQQNVKKYRSYGLSLNKNEENSGCRRIARSEENIERVKIMLENVPRTLLQEELAWDYLLQHLTEYPAENCVNTHTWQKFGNS